MNPTDAGKNATRWVLILTGVGSLMAALDTLVVSTALSTIRLHLDASVEQLEWTVNARLLLAQSPVPENRGVLGSIPSLAISSGVSALAV
jgi:hypothetical protein